MLLPLQKEIIHELLTFRGRIVDDCRKRRQAVGHVIRLPILPQTEISDPLFVEFHQQGQAETAQTALPDRLRIKTILAAAETLFITVQQYSPAIAPQLPTGSVTHFADRLRIEFRQLIGQILLTRQSQQLHQQAQVGVTVFQSMAPSEHELRGQDKLSPLFQGTEHPQQFFHRQSLSRLPAAERITVMGHAKSQFIIAEITLEPHRRRETTQR